MSKRVYLASWFSSREAVKAKRAELEACGVAVVSRWLDETTSLTAEVEDLVPEWLATRAKMDIADIENSEVFVVFTPDPEDLPRVSISAWARGGRHFETGYAYMLGREIIICGPRENIFHFLPGIKQFDTWEEVKKEVCNEF